MRNSLRLLSGKFKSRGRREGAGKYAKGPCGTEGRRRGDDEPHEAERVVDGLRCRLQGCCSFRQLREACLDRTVAVGWDLH